MDDDVDWEEAARIADLHEQKHVGNQISGNATRAHEPHSSSSASICQGSAKPDSRKGAPDSVFSTFIFPRSDDYATREYQKNIVTSSLLKNTLVVLPTGLGKTFIAAVVMYNFLRWFPDGKIVFMAPTRPLVNQQIQACHDVVGISEEETAEMNGQVSADKRARLWRDKRVFYCTPQTAEKDLDSDSMPRNKISLIVVDEAHRAVGKYAFVNVVQAVYASNKRFRVLALSATPGKDYAKVQEVVSNLLIANIEYKSETDIDVRPYVFQKMMDVVHCQMNTRCLSLLEDFNKFIEVPLKRLRSTGHCPMLTGSAKDISSFQVVNMMNSLTVGGSELNLGQLNALRADLGLLSSLVHVRTLMVTHGLSAAVNHMKTHFEGDLKGTKRVLVMSPEWRQFQSKLAEALRQGGANPKISKLKEILHEHFERYKEAGKTTSVIVFAQYRDSVVEIVQDLRMSTALRVSPFVGQAKSKTPESENTTSGKSSLFGAGAKVAANTAPKTLPNGISNGQSQKEQQEVVRKFRAGELDVLVATCIGEEGLDIGSVDLIVSYDALQSPVRMIQRFGRAGRKRAGRIIVLVADDKEKQMLTNGTKMSASVHRLLRENVWKIKLFRPPLDACMFPDSNAMPRIAFQKLDIAEYRGENVGGHSNKKKRRSELLEDTEDALEFRSEPLTAAEFAYFRSRFGTVTLNSLTANEDRQPMNYGELLSMWRSPIQRFATGESDRSYVMQNAVQFIALEMWNEDVASRDHVRDGNHMTSPHDLDDLNFDGLIGLTVRKSPSVVSIPAIQERELSRKGRLAEGPSCYIDSVKVLGVTGVLRAAGDVDPKQDSVNVCEGCEQKKYATNVPTSSQRSCTANDNPSSNLLLPNDLMDSKPKNTTGPGNDERTVSLAVHTDSDRKQNLGAMYVSFEDGCATNVNEADDDIPAPPPEEEWECSQLDDGHFASQKCVDSRDSQSPILARRPRPAFMVMDAAAVVPETGKSRADRRRKRLVMSASTAEDEKEEMPILKGTKSKSLGQRRTIDSASGESPHEVGDEDEDRLKKTRELKRVKGAFFVDQAEVEEDDHGSGDDLDGSDLDQDLESFIDDGTQEEEIYAHAHPRGRLLHLKESPMESISLKPGQKVNLGAMPVIARTLQRMKERLDQGLPPSPEEEDDDEEKVVEVSESELEAPGESSDFSTAESPAISVRREAKLASFVPADPRMHPIAVPVRMELPSNLSAVSLPKPTLLQSAHGLSDGPQSSSRTCQPLVKVQVPPSEATIHSTTADALTSSSALSEDVRRRIEEKRLQALQRLQQKQNLPASSTTGKFQIAPPPLSSPKGPTSASTNSATGPFVASSSSQAPQGSSTTIAEKASFPERPPLFVHHMYIDGGSFSSSLEALKRDGLAVALHKRSCELHSFPAFRSFGADIVLTHRLAVRLIPPADVVGPGGSAAKVESALNRALQHYAEVAAIVVLDVAGVRVPLTDGRLEELITRLRLWNDAGVRLFVVHNSDEVASVLVSLAAKEGLEMKGGLTGLRQILGDPQKRAVVEFLSKARESNSMIAAAMVAHFQSSTVAELIDTLSRDLLCNTIAPGLPQTQATKIVLFFKRVWKPDAVQAVLGPASSSAAPSTRRGR